MNYKYDSNSARLWLDAHIQSSLQNAGPIPLLRDLHVSESEATRFDHPPTIRLVKRAADGGLDEVTVKVAGVIASKTLPPVYGPIRSNDHEHIRHLRQFVRLTGLGSLEFDSSAARVDEVVSIFESAVGDNMLLPLEFGTYEGMYSIDLHARYLTERRLAGDEFHIPFTPDIDPNHALDEARDTSFIRLRDNEVQYMSRQQSADGTYFNEPLEPVNFKEGDIVEATGTFIAYPLGSASRGDVRHKLVFTLRSLTMLNAQFREDSRVKRTIERYEPQTPRHMRSKTPSSRTLRRHVIPTGEPSKDRPTM